MAQGHSAVAAGTDLSRHARLLAAVHGANNAIGAHGTRDPVKVIGQCEHRRVSPLFGRHQFGHVVLDVSRRFTGR